MDEQPDPRREKKVKLVARPGETSVFIDAEIDEKGNLPLSGQDVGKAPKDWFGDEVGHLAEGEWRVPRRL